MAQGRRVDANRAVEAMVRSHRLRPWEGSPGSSPSAPIFSFPIIARSARRSSSPSCCRCRSISSWVMPASSPWAMRRSSAPAPMLRACSRRMAGASRSSSLVAGGLVAALLGLASGAIILRARGLTLLMLTLVTAFMLQEAANKATAITGGDDGLQGMIVWPVLGLFPFDIYGRTAYLYCLAVLFLAWYVVRRIVHSPFGRALTGIRESEARMHAIGSPVFRRRLAAYTIAAGLAGVAGALLAETTQFVALEVLGLGRSGRCSHHAHHRRRRPALRRFHRRPPLQDRARPVLRDQCRLLEFLDRPAAGARRPVRPRRHPRACRAAAADAPGAGDDAPRSRRRASARASARSPSRATSISGWTGGRATR